MWSSPLFWKLLVAYVGLNLASAAVFVAIVSGWQRTQMLDEIERRLRDMSTVLASHLADDAAQRRYEILDAEVTRLAGQLDARITVVDLQGHVLADSHEEAETMENHRSRRELADAMTHGYGVATRHSPTLQVEMLYCAVQAQADGRPVGLVRVAMPTEAIRREIATTARLIWTATFVAGMATLILTYWLVAHIIRPLHYLTNAAKAIAAGDYRQQVKISQRDELGVLADAFNGMSQDLSQRMTQMRDTSERLATVLRSMAEGVIAVDHDERIILANAAAGALLDFAAPDATGRPLLEVVHSSALHAAVESALENEEPQAQEFQLTGPPRRVLALNARRLPGDLRAGALLVLRDISELRRLENLRHEFVANVSHELKTPLTSIKAYAETLREGAIHDSQHNTMFVERIEEQADRLHQLILDMLSLAQIESGQPDLELDTVPVAELVDLTLKHHASLAKAKQITLVAVPCPQPVVVRAEREGLRQILDNLIDNAVKYTQPGGRVVVRCREEDGVGLLEVEDTGIGIDTADQARIFERFYRVDKARSRELGGTGLGLSIVKHLAQAFGGNVTVCSQLGQGTTFCVRLPLG